MHIREPFLPFFYIAASGGITLRNAPLPAALPLSAGRRRCLPSSSSCRRPPSPAACDGRSLFSCSCSESCALSGVSSNRGDVGSLGAAVTLTRGEASSAPASLINAFATASVVFVIASCTCTTEYAIICLAE